MIEKNLCKLLTYTDAPTDRLIPGLTYFSRSRDQNVNKSIWVDRGGTNRNRCIQRLVIFACKAANEVMHWVPSVCMRACVCLSCLCSNYWQRHIATGARGATATKLASCQSYDDCLEVKREYYQNCSVLDCVTQCSQSTAHLCEQFLQVQQIGFVTLGPLCSYAVHRGGCLELYDCNMVEWFWWDSSLISTTNWFPSVLWHCWFGHLACKNCPQITYNVLPLHYYYSACAMCTGEPPMYQ